ncbi:hypothetical protein [Guptibacillus hwajinpoensis]|uniref:Uncharacterized protein n=1 Tax=Guptibacillus hwajinpoensis TaxID=208199 RepID=A0A0J6FY58_9BACL|nr:hypothetical protein [Alkalihalobacillus macyae]KMM39282.1 hypothetical protein AB986_08725 [Alkalihalobacillus macyae]
MKEFIAIVVTVIATNRITEQVYEKMNFHYNWFEDRFSLKSLLMDLGIYFIIGVPIYLIVEMLIDRGRSLFNNKRIE